MISLLSVFTIRGLYQVFYVENQQDTLSDFWPARSALCILTRTVCNARQKLYRRVFSPLLVGLETSTRTAAISSSGGGSHEFGCNYNIWMKMKCSVNIVPSLFPSFTSGICMFCDSVSLFCNATCDRHLLMLMFRLTCITRLFPFLKAILLRLPSWYASHVHVCMCVRQTGAERMSQYRTINVVTLPNVAYEFPALGPYDVYMCFVDTCRVKTTMKAWRGWRWEGKERSCCHGLRVIKHAGCLLPQ